MKINKKKIKSNLIKVQGKYNFSKKNKQKYSQYILSLKILSVFILLIIVIYYYIYNKNSFISFITKE